jgi:hypothetical protein
MKSCILIQCYVKPVETIKILKSLELCDGITNYSLVLFIDKAAQNTKFSESNSDLIDEVSKYKLENQSKFEDVIIYINDCNLGPYLTCCKAIDFCFETFDFVVFSEDDAIFCKDSISYFNNYRDGKIPNPENCLGISSESIQFGEDCKESSSFCINAEKNNVIQNKLINKVQKIQCMPSKQFGLFQNKWEKVRQHRLVSDGYAHEYIKKSTDLFMYFSIIPRTNDIGLTHPLGCTTLYWDRELPKSTIKYLTSDDFYYNSIFCDLEII